MNEFFDIWKKIANMDMGVSVFISFDKDDGTLNLEWVGKNRRALASFSPDPKGTGWSFVSLDPIGIDGPHNDFNDRFFECLKLVEKDAFPES